MSEESTTPDLVERWQETADAYARRDIHTAMRFYAPDAVWDGSSAGVGGYFEGATAIRSFLEDWIMPTRRANTTRRIATASATDRFLSGLNSSVPPPAAPARVTPHVDHQS